MIKHHTIVGALLLSLTFSFTAPVFNVNSNTSYAATARPTISDLRQALTNIEAVGEYKTLFATQTTLSSNVEFYQEYNYLHDIATTIQEIIPKYSSISTQDLQDIVDASFHAVKACRLILGITAQEIAAEQANIVAMNNQAILAKQATAPSVATTQAAQSASSSLQVSVTVANEPEGDTDLTSNNTDNSNNNIDNSIEDTTNPNAENDTENITTDATEDTSITDQPITVPTTGDISDEFNLPLPAIVAIIGGSAVLAIALTGIIRRSRRHAYRH